MHGRNFIKFKGISEFEEFYKGLDIYGGTWKIRDGLLNERGKLVQDKEYFKKLRAIFDGTDLFYKKVSMAETVSWLDSFIHIQRISTILKKQLDSEILCEIDIIFEYVIEMSKSSRVDVIFKYRRSLCLFEFSTVNKFERMKRAYQQKRIELMIYKDLMLNYLPSGTKIYLFPFIGLYEYFKNQRVESHYFNNIRQAEFAAEYINKFLINDYCIQFE